MKHLRQTLLALLAALSVGCEANVDSVFTPHIVIEGYLYANEPMDSIVLRHTVDIGTVDSTPFISGANVTLEVGDESYKLVERVGLPGRYFAPITLPIAPGRTYKLRVEALGQVATSETTVPRAIHLDSAKIEDRRLSLDELDTIDFPGSENELSKPGIQLWWSKGELSKGYALEAVSFDTSNKLVDRNFDNFVRDSTSHGRYRFFVLSETEQVTWLQFKRYGENTLRVLSLDRNMQDFALGIYLSRSQFDNNTLRINGGLGIFGSAARASKRIYLKDTSEE